MGRDKGIRNWKYWCSRVDSGLAMWKNMAERQGRGGVKLAKVGRHGTDRRVGLKTGMGTG